MKKVILTIAIITFCLSLNIAFGQNNTGTDVLEVANDGSQYTGSGKYNHVGMSLWLKMGWYTVGAFALFGAWRFLTGVNDDAKTFNVYLRVAVGGCITMAILTRVLG